MDRHQTDLVEWMLQRGADPLIEHANWTPLALSVFQGDDLSLIQQLFSSARVSQRELNTLALWAVDGGDADAMHFF